MRKFFFAPALAGLVIAGGLAVTTPAALALDGQDFANKLTESFMRGNTALDIGSAEASGDTVTLSGLSFTPPGEKKVAVPGTLVFTGVKETAEGGYTADRGKMDDVDFSDKGVSVSIKNIVLTDIKLPADPKADVRGLMTLYKSFGMGPITVTMDGSDVFSVAAVKADNVPSADMSSVDSTSSVTGIHADLSKINDPEVTGMLGMFGLTTIDATMSSKSHWNLDTGDLDVSQAQLDVANVGKLNFTTKLGGYDMDMIEKLMAAQDQMAELTKDDSTSPAAIDAEGMKVLNTMIDKLSLGSLSIRYDDAGFAPKLLAMLAQQSGMTADTMATAYAGMLPAFAAQAGLPPETQTMLLTAATAFLKDPKNITISVTPDKPVPFKSLETMTSDPATAVKTLNLNVVANQ